MVDRFCSSGRVSIVIDQAKQVAIEYGDLPQGLSLSAILSLPGGCPSHQRKENHRF